MKYQCSVCGKNIEDNLVVYIDHTEQHIIEEISKKHPDWAQEDGICAKCVKYYKDQLHGEFPE